MASNEANSAATNIADAGPNHPRQNGDGPHGKLPKENVNSPYCGMLLCNIQGLKTYRIKQKVEVLKEKAIEENIAVVALTETHLNDGIGDAEI